MALEHRREGKWTRPREETGGAGGRGRARRRQGWEERGGVKTEEEEGIRPRRGGGGGNRCVCVWGGGSLKVTGANKMGRNDGGRTKRLGNEDGYMMNTV